MSNIAGGQRVPAVLLGLLLEFLAFLQFLGSQDDDIQFGAGGEVRAGDDGYLCVTLVGLFGCVVGDLCGGVMRNNRMNISFIKRVNGKWQLV